MKSFSALLAMLLLAANPLHATTRTYSSLDDFIDGADVIDIVRVGPRHPDLGYPNPDKRSPYQQATEAVLKQTLKGLTLQTIHVRHGKALDDSLFQQSEGLYLVFLKQTSGGLVPFDGWPSSKEIKNNQVLGWKQHPYYSHDAGTSLDEVVTQIAQRSKKLD